MNRILRHPLLLAVAMALFLYALFAYGVRPPVPRSLLILFMIISVIGVLLVATFEDETARRMAEPVRALLGAPGLKVARTLVGLAVVAAVFGFTAGRLQPERSAPVELRSVHPAPPSTLRVFGRSYDLRTLRNPLRDSAPKGSPAFAAAVREGAELYYRNCLFCHGDRLDGRGPFALGFNPRPADFQDVGTIAQLQESYLFWRIATGGPGLPREGAPWASSMPAWHEMLSEDEIWKVIAFLYDETGHEPRSWEQNQTSPGTTAPAGAAGRAEPARQEAARAVYQRRCAQCHGEEGDGRGVVAERMEPRPRDFTFGILKFKTTPAGSEYPAQADLRRTIAEGLPGTAMPAWRQILAPAEIDALVDLIRGFGGWAQEPWAAPLADDGEPAAATRESIARGRELFAKTCAECHGAKGRGDSTSEKKLKDEWGARIFPRNLTRPATWRWVRGTRDLFVLISVGIPGTPMPEHTSKLSVQERWDIAHFVMTLQEGATPVVASETVLRGVRIEGPLPADPGDPAWERAPAITWPLVPNVIKEPRLFFSLNTQITARLLYNADALALRLDVDDRTYSVPGHPRERAMAHDDIAPTRDALAVQFPAALPTTSERPWFRHGDAGHPVNLWYWGAPSADPAEPARVRMLDAAGPDRPPVPRPDGTALTASAAWQDGQWRVVMQRALRTEHPGDIQFEVQRFIPLAFANWDGWAGQSGGRHTLTAWYWMTLEPDLRPARVYGLAALSGLAAALAFIGLVWREQRAWRRRGRSN